MQPITANEIPKCNVMCAGTDILNECEQDGISSLSLFFLGKVQMTSTNDIKKIELETEL